MGSIHLMKINQQHSEHIPLREVYCHLNEQEASCGQWDLYRHRNDLTVHKVLDEGLEVLMEHQAKWMLPTELFLGSGFWSATWFSVFIMQTDFQSLSPLFFLASSHWIINILHIETCLITIQIELNRRNFRNVCQDGYSDHMPWILSRLVYAFLDERLCWGS